MSGLPLIRTVLVVVLVTGALGAAGPSISYAEFTNDHDGNGTVNASSVFGPIANAGGSYTVYEDSSIQLDGTNSTVSQGSLDYSWTIDNGNGSLSDTTSSTPTYNAPTDVDGDIAITVQLTVTDSVGTDTDTVNVTVMDGDGGCGAAELTFCSYDAVESSNSYDISYKIDDPSGGAEFKNVTVTLRRAKNDNVRDTVSSTNSAATVSVSDNGKVQNKQYNITVELYDTNGSVDECLAATDAGGDGMDPSLSPC